MSLENLADKVKEMRGLQIRYDKARTTGQVKVARLLKEQLTPLEKEVDTILLNHFYTPESKQVNFFDALDNI